MNLLKHYEEIINEQRIVIQEMKEVVDNQRQLIREMANSLWNMPSCDCEHPYCNMCKYYQEAERLIKQAASIVEGVMR